MKIMFLLDIDASFSKIDQMSWGIVIPPCVHSQTAIFCSGLDEKKPIKEPSKYTGLLRQTFSKEQRLDLHLKT